MCISPAIAILWIHTRRTLQIFALESGVRQSTWKSRWRRAVHLAISPPKFRDSRDRHASLERSVWLTTPRPAFGQIACLTFGGLLKLISKWGRGLNLKKKSGEVTFQYPMILLLLPFSLRELDQPLPPAGVSCCFVAGDEFSAVDTACV